MVLPEKIPSLAKMDIDYRGNKINKNMYKETPIDKNTLLLCTTYFLHHS